MMPKHVFPGVKQGKGLSSRTLLTALEQMQDGVTVHGFRSSFRTLAHMVGGRGTDQLSP
jgi:hypothetical protein